MRKIIAVSLLLSLTYTCSAQRISIPKQDSTAGAYLLNDFKCYDPHYAEKKDVRISRIKKLAKQVFALECQGQPTGRSHQILFDFTTINQRINDLQQSLSLGFDQSRADSINSWDGSHGTCYQEWFLKVNKSYDYLEKGASGETSWGNCLPF